MHEDDGDIEEWAQQLRGKASAKDTPVATSALRSAIAVSNRAESDAVASDRMAHSRLIKRLEQEGLLSDGPLRSWWRRIHVAIVRALKVPAADRSLETRLGEPGLPSSDTPGRIGPRPRWHGWAGAMAAVLIVAIGVRLVLLPDPDPRGILISQTDPGFRGFVGSVTLLSEQPVATLAEAGSQLDSLGLKSRRVTEDGRVFLELDVSQQQLETFFNWAQAHGGRPVTAGRYRIFVDSKPDASH
jgi:hypothetical protein